MADVDLRRALMSEDAASRLKAVRTIAGMACAAHELLRFIRPLLDDRKSEIRLYAAVILAEAGAERDPKLAPVFLSGVRSGPREQMLALRGMIAWRYSDETILAALPELIKIVQKHNDLTGAAIVLVGRCGSRASQACPSLVDLMTDASLDDNYPSMRLAAARALARIGKPSLPYLVRTLDVKDSTVQQLALQAIEILGPTAKDAGPIVARFRLSSDPYLRELATSCLKRIESK